MLCEKIASFWDIDFLLILSRTKTIPADVKESYIQTAQNAGYDLSGFVWTEQE